VPLFTRKLSQSKAGPLLQSDLVEYASNCSGLRPNDIYVNLLRALKPPLDPVCKKDTSTTILVNLTRPNFFRSKFDEFCIEIRRESNPCGGNLHLTRSSTLTTRPTVYIRLEPNVPITISCPWRRVCVGAFPCPCSPGGIAWHGGFRTA